MYDFLNKIGIKIMLEAVKSKFPESLPANGGNADTLDGLHAAAFLQNVVPVNLTTSINDMTTAGTYGVYSGTPDLPSGYGSWGFLEVRRFGLLCYQTIIFENGVIISRGIQTNGGDWNNWRCAYTNIDKPYVTGSVVATSHTITTNHGFQPSAVLYSISEEDYNVRGTASFDSTSFAALGNIPSSGTLVHYIIFK